MDRRARADVESAPGARADVDPGGFVPKQGSFLTSKYLYREGIGAHRWCLDIGGGSGLLTIGLARTGAAHVRAIDIDEAAVTNTLTNAFRSGVADRVSALACDLYPWVPEERYDAIFASQYQMLERLGYSARVVDFSFSSSVTSSRASANRSVASRRSPTRTT